MWRLTLFKEKIDKLQKQRFDKFYEYQMLAIELSNSVLDVVKEAYPAFSKDRHELSHWECPESPFGYCLYDMYEDLVCDMCIFCGDPLERK